MTPSDLIKQLETFDQNKSVLAQVVATNGQAWNMRFTFTEIPSFIVLTLSHPELLYLPSENNELIVIDTCDAGHKFAKLNNHPTRDGKARCPYCLVSGFDALRKELGETL